MRIPIKSVMVLAVFGALLVSGCGQQQEPANVAGEASKPRIAVIMKSLANEFFVNMAEGTRQHHAENSDTYELILNGIKDEAALTEQVALVEQMIALKVDVIVLAPADSKALIPIVRRATAQGIVVINIDNQLDAALIAEAGISVPFVGPDNREGARKVGDYLANSLNAGDEVAIIGGISTAFNAQQRQQGFEDAMAAVGASIVSVQDGSWHQAEASTIASALISEYPNLKALLCSNDNMAIGAVAAVRQAGKIGQIQVVGFDNISATHELLRNGDMLATADQYGNQLAVYGIEYALQILNDGIVPDDRKTPVDLITASDL
ncbi:MAG: sugar ABC transporter substrate-binding protein [Gammaproteobacteria bacterium]|nr:sugar ABC transporter substrate-binding protein [Gammaproteobacteria bacterium]